MVTQGGESELKPAAERDDARAFLPGDSLGRYMLDRLTLSGAVLGTPADMSAEQFEGRQVEGSLDAARRAFG